MRLCCGICSIARLARLGELSARLLAFGIRPPAFGIRPPCRPLAVGPYLALRAVLPAPLAALLAFRRCACLRASACAFACLLACVRCDYVCLMARNARNKGSAYAVMR